MFMFTQNAGSEVKPFPWNVTPGIAFTGKSKIQNIIRQLPLLHRNVGDIQQQVQLLTCACYNTGNTFREQENT